MLKTDPNVIYWKEQINFKRLIKEINPILKQFIEERYLEAK